MMARMIKLGFTLAGLMALAACGSRPEPAPPPPPPKDVAIPPRPTAPDGASPNLAVPPRDATGLYQSINRGITPAQITWNLRSAFNVAALNCRDAQFAEILADYRKFLVVHGKGLTASNKRVDSEFKATYGSGYIPYRETYMTGVYNHYALPPIQRDFCEAVMVVGREARVIKPAELENFAARSLPSIEVVFDNFYRRYDQYRASLADWETRYGQRNASAPPAYGTAQGGAN